MNTYTHKSLAVARQSLGYSLDDVVRRLYADHKVEVSGRTISNWEEGFTHPDADILPSLLTVLHLKLENLYEASSNDKTS